MGERLPLRILAADDVRANRELIRHVAGHLGYEVEVVENGAEVLSALSQCSFDLILLDAQMPVMDGLDAAREIVRLQPDPGRRPKMVAISAVSIAADQKACLAAGMDDCLDKPISPRALEACIVRLFADAGPVQTPPLHPVAMAKTLPPPLVDRVHLETAMAGLSGANLAETQRRMHRAVVKDFESIWPRIILAVSHQDQSQLAEALHALKGCFSALGWKRIADRCSGALQSARAQQFAEWSTFPDELQQLYAASTAEMTKYLAELEAPAPTVPAARDEKQTSR